MQFEVVEGEESTVSLVLKGEIDLEWSPALRDVLLECLSRARDVRVDMAGVTVIDSSGVASLLEAFQNARKKGKTFVLCSVGETAMRVLKLARLETVFVIEDSC